MDFLRKRLDEGYNLIVVKRKKPSVYYCSKEEKVEESGTLNSYDEFKFENNIT